MIDNLQNILGDIIDNIPGNIDYVRLPDPGNGTTGGTPKPSVEWSLLLTDRHVTSLEDGPHKR